MRGDTHARLTLVVGILVGLVPVRSWERGEIDTSTMAVRLAVAILVTWAVLLLVGRVVSGYRAGGRSEEVRDAADASLRRRADDRAMAARAAGDAEA